MPDELFPAEGSDNQQSVNELPLAIRMRPRTIEEFVGQNHLLGREGFIRLILKTKRLPSLILYGPPGCGKTALALVMARETGYAFHHLNAVTATVADVREVMLTARQRTTRTILFLDEIAHFNRLQQDCLMRDVEEGTIILIGATTHNPFFFVNTPLLSRAKVLELKPLTEEEIKEIIRRALRDKERGLGQLPILITEEALEFLARMSEGDARRVLNALEVGALIAQARQEGEIHFDLALAEKAVQQKALRYDRVEDLHHDTISAFIKSMRGSDPDATLYWLARMVAAGEDPRFIARRIVICAAEDVGNADPQALVVATAAFQAVSLVGMPEGRIILAQAALYVATAPKSNSAYRGISEALQAVEKEKTQEVPQHLRQAGYSGARKLGRGQGYLYPHDYPDHYVPQTYLPVARSFYHPAESGYERKIILFLKHLERLKREHEKQTAGRNAAGKADPGRTDLAGKKPSDSAKTAE
ncbi:MAG TPA: replication-associated recombination protein A [bacterium]|nr:replication-associated recombination protein A [bacterium]